MQFKRFFFVSVLFFAFLLPACVGTKERETNRLLLLHKRYGSSIIRILTQPQNGVYTGGTAFYTGQQTGFVTARHSLVFKDKDGSESFSRDWIMLHIPSCETGYTANMGDAVEDKGDAAAKYLNDWANFIPEEDKLTRNPLRYDPSYPLHNGQKMFIAGYPDLNSDHDYTGTIPEKYAFTHSFLTYVTTHHFGTASQTGDRKLNFCSLVNGLYQDQAGRGMSGGPVLVWDKNIEDFIAVGIVVYLGSRLHMESPILYFIRPQISPIVSNPETN